jgi:hypothetical protein
VPLPKTRISARLSAVAVLSAKSHQPRCSNKVQQQSSLLCHTQPWIEPRAFPVSARSSKTIATARSRSSAGCAFRDAMSPNFPRG